jgi:hypothetical protein
MQTDTHPACTHDHTLTEELNREINIQEEMIAQLCEDPVAERAVSRALARNTNATPVTTTTASTPTPQKIPDPGKYGGDRNKLRSFLVPLRLKAANIPTVPENLRFTVNCLKDDALDQVSPYVKDDTVDLPDLSALVQILEYSFCNRNRIQDAELKLNTLEQRSRDFSSYYAEFCRYPAEVSWNKGAKLAAVRHGISGTLKCDLIPTLENSQTVTDFVKICQQLDNRRRTVNQESDWCFGNFTQTGGSASNTSRTTPAPVTSSSPTPNNTSLPLAQLRFLWTSVPTVNELRPRNELEEWQKDGASTVEDWDTWHGTIPLTPNNRLPGRLGPMKLRPAPHLHPALWKKSWR